MNNENLIYKIAIGQIPGIGPVSAKNLIAYVGSVEDVFKESAQKLLKINGIGEFAVKTFLKHKNEKIKEAENEINFIIKHNIKTVFYTDNNYPEYLKQCNDAPLLLFYKGNLDINGQKTLSIVGTRNASSDGKENCEILIKDLAQNNKNLIIISGLAYGIDICAHKAAIKNNLKTIAVLGHALDRIYPTVHSGFAQDIINEGGAIISEFTSNTKFEKQNFLRRNRIIAGISQATVVAESAIKGGSLTTADIANSYNREVFAFPGRINDKYSQGCNMLIKTHKALLIENAADIEYNLSWENSNKINSVQQNIFIELSDDEKTIIEILKNNDKPVIDFICKESKMTMNKVSAMLLELEFKGAVKCLPGKIYETATNFQ